MDSKKRSGWILTAAGIVLLVVTGWQVFAATTSDIRILGTLTPTATKINSVTTDIPTLTPAAEIFIPTATTEPVVPAAIRIGKIELEAPILPVEQVQIKIEEQDYAQFLVPEEFAAGWHTGSAPLSAIGNTVISGHHNAHGRVFADLQALEVGDRIEIDGARGESFSYIVANKMILREEDEPLEVRIRNARWMLPSDDERLTLITCWPEESNSHRLILVAVREPNYSQMAAEAQQPPSLAGIDLTTPAVIASDTESEPQTQSKECTASNAAGFDINLRDKPALHGAIAATWEIGVEARAIRLSADGEWVKLQVDSSPGWTALSLVGLDCDPAELPTGE